MTDAERLRELVAEAVLSVDHRNIGCEPHDGLGAVIIGAPETNQALLWIRGGPGDTRPALIQKMIPFDDRPIEVDEETAEAAADWLETRRGRWAALRDPDAEAADTTHRAR
jgi:hypothetical protein